MIFQAAIWMFSRLEVSVQTTRYSFVTVNSLVKEHKTFSQTAVQTFLWFSSMIKKKTKSSMKIIHKKEQLHQDHHEIFNKTKKLFVLIACDSSKVFFWQAMVQWRSSRYCMLSKNLHQKLQPLTLKPVLTLLSCPTILPQLHFLWFIWHFFIASIYLQAKALDSEV